MILVKGADDMTQLILKFVVYPIIVFMFNSLIPGIHFSTLGQILMVGWSLAILSYLIDLALLRQYGNLVQAAIDFVMIASMLVIFQYYMRNSTISFFSANVTALVIATIEYYIHKWLLQNEQGYYKHHQ